MAAGEGFTHRDNSRRPASPSLLTYIADLVQVPALPAAVDHMCGQCLAGSDGSEGAGKDVSSLD